MGHSQQRACESCCNKDLDPEFGLIKNEVSGYPLNYPEVMNQERTPEEKEPKESKYIHMLNHENLDESIPISKVKELIETLEEDIKIISRQYPDHLLIVGQVYASRKIISKLKSLIE